MYRKRENLKRLLKLITSLILGIILTACVSLRQVSAEERLFLPLSVQFLSEFQLAKQSFAETPVGGLSAITYDRSTNRFYALSDDHSQNAPARFYTLNLQITPTADSKATLDRVSVEGVTLLQDAQGELYAPQAIDPEGMALSARDTVFIASEGIPKRTIPPFIGEFEAQTGKNKQILPLPQRFLAAAKLDSSPRGVQENLGFEALTLSAKSSFPDDPFRLFVATESSLFQDNAKTSDDRLPVRLLHYVINPIGSAVLVAEHLYLLEPPPPGAISNGLSELIALDQEGYWLSLERTFGLFGSGAKLFQVANSNATDTSQILSFQANLNQLIPLKKKLLLDFGQLGIELDNLEAMCLGPHLPDGTQTLILVSDDNFNPTQVTQFLLLRLATNS